MLHNLRHRAPPKLPFPDESPAAMCNVQVRPGVSGRGHPLTSCPPAPTPWVAKSMCLPALRWCWASSHLGLTGRNDPLVLKIFLFRQGPIAQVSPELLIFLHQATCVLGLWTRTMPSLTTV